MLAWMLIGSATIAAEPQRLTDSGRLKFSPVFINQGRELVFVELTDPTIYRLQKLTLESGKIEPLHPEATTSEFEPAVAPDGECFAFLKTRGTLSIGITVCDAQQAVLGEIQPFGGFFGFRHPTLAPGKSRIAYSYGEKGAQQIYASKFNGEDRQPLTNTKGLNQWPNYSPKGDFLAFSSSRDGNFEIYVMRADGSDQRRLTDQPLQDIRPRWSPDGNRIAWTSHRDGNAEIYLMRADGSDVRRLSQHPERDDYADWHPDGKNLATISERAGRLDVYLWAIDP